MALNPLGPVASAFYLDNSEVAAIMGPVGSAKSTAAACRIVRHAYEQSPHNGIRHSRWAIVRNTGPQLNDTTIKTWLKLFPENIYGKFATTSKTHRWRFIPKGSKEIIDAEFIFRALDDEDDVANLLSLEVTGMWFNELREINTTILAHAGRRAGRYPGADLGGCTWRGWIGDTNPWAATSDLHEMFVADPRQGYAYFKQPGGMEPDAENLENLEQTPQTIALPWNDPKRREQGRTYYINGLRDYSKTDGDMYVHCKYGASRDGKPVFVSYDDNAHIKSFELLQWQEHPKAIPVTPLLIGYDNTGRNPAAVIGQKTEDGQWRIAYEFCAEGMGMKQHAKALKAFLAQMVPNYQIKKITCDPAGKAKGADDLDMRMIIALEFPGVPVLNARTNDPATRIEAVDGLFRRMVNGEPAIWIHPRCKILRTACINKYRYRKLKISGEDRYTETPDKITPYADVADGLQYLALGGGEGRLNSGTPADQQPPPWPTDGAAITMNKPKGWNPLGVPHGEHQPS
jgi:hypothetical protein